MRLIRHSPSRENASFMHTSRSLFAIAAALAVASAAPVHAQRPAATPRASAFDVTETTIADIHAAMRAHALSCHDLVSAYLARIAAYDKNGPAINSIIVVNPNAMAVDSERLYAGTLDRGIQIYNGSQGSWQVVREGLPSQNVTAFAFTSDHVLVGTDRGVVEIRKDAF